MLLRFILWFTSLSFLLSCVNEDDYTIDSAEIHPTIALPLVSGDLSVQDLIKSKDSVYVKVYPDDLVYLSYSQVLKSQGIRDLFGVPDKNLNRSFFVPPATVPPLAQDLRTDSIMEVVDFGLSPEQLDEISFASGQITYSTSISPSSSSLNYEVNISLPDFISKTTNKPFNINTSSSGSILMEDYVVQLDKNKFDMKLVLVFKKSTSSVVIGPGTFVNVKLSFLGMDFVYIKGFFGDQVANLPSDTVEIGAFGTALDEANVSFADPKINLVVVNENGVPCEVDFKKLKGQKNGQSIGLILNPANPVSVAYPTVLGSSATTSVAVANVKDVLNFAPEKFLYQIDARINKGLTSGNNFLADTSKLTVRMDVEVPLYGQASGIELLDTLSLDLGDIDESTIDSASLKIKMTNELPMDGNVQLYLTDENYRFIDSLLVSGQTNLIKGSSVTASGDLESPGVLDQLLPLDTDKLNKVFDSKYVIVRARMNTSRDSSGAAIDVKFKSKYKMIVNLGLLASLKLTAKL